MPRFSPSRRSQFYGWLAMGCAIAVFIGSGLLPHRAPRLLTAAGVSALALAVPLMFTPFYFLKRHGRVPPGRPYYQTTILVDRGPYRLVRHPQYLGYALLLAGLALLTCHWLTLGAAAAGALCFYLQAAAEEEQIVAALGRPYLDYMTRVPRFNPLGGLYRLVRLRFNR